MLQKRWSMAVLSVLRGREADFSFKDTFNKRAFFIFAK